MENTNNAPNKDQGSNNKEQREGNANPQANNEEEKKLHLAPNKDRDYKVLHKDGSLADLHQGAEGRGALEGTVGLGM